MRAKCLFWLLALAIVVGAVWAQEQKPPAEDKSAPAATAAPPATPHPPRVTPEDAARKNPIKFTTLSVERGAKLYRTQCAMCHGEKGDGKGDMVAEMKMSPPDFTKPETLKDRTDGALFALIGAGSEVMPSQGTRMTDTHKWNLVNFLRSLSGKPPERATGKEPEENIILVPQDEKK
ncbi:MAG: cytochrome c [Terriglobia bacterium]